MHPLMSLVSRPDLTSRQVEPLKKLRLDSPSLFKAGRSPRALVMDPTRELAHQVQKELDLTCSAELATTCVYGVTPYDPHMAAFWTGVDVVVGTPGRLINHIERGNLLLEELMFVCMDEADQMLDTGFAKRYGQDHEFWEQKAAKESGISHQVLLFSATYS